MTRRYLIRLFRLYFILLMITVLFSWLIPSVLYEWKKDRDDLRKYYEDILDNHVYPPPWYISNWTIKDYFLRKDNLKQLEDQHAIDKKQKLVIEHGFVNQKKEQKLDYMILEYTTVFGRPKFCGKTQEFIFGKQCPYQNCRYTCDRNASNIADVLLMHRSDIHIDQLPTVRHPDQIWLFWHDEPGGIQQQAIVAYQFNWTISYRSNAEANIGAYGLTILRRKRLSLKEFDSYVNEQFDTRQANAIWFVSNCQPRARRDFYMKFRSYYPSIIVYGKCLSHNQSNQCSRYSQCEISQLTKNKFYLAFESQSCRDYITEKFWRSLAFGIIPIVFGPRTKLSLERIAPPNSFIYTGDFTTMEELARYLNEIARNRTLFREYHRWRRFYDILYRQEDIEQYRFCELCYRLNTNHQRIYYQNLNEFFLEDC